MITDLIARLETVEPRPELAEAVALARRLERERLPVEQVMALQPQIEAALAVIDETAIKSRRMLERCEQMLRPVSGSVPTGF